MKFLQTALIAMTLQTCGLYAADYFPLDEGNAWTYRDATTGQTFTVRVGDEVTKAGNTYYKLTGYGTSDLLVRVEPSYGALMYWDDARLQEMLLTSFEQFEGGYWVAPFRPCPDQVGQTLVKRGVHDGPAGPVADVLEVRYVGFGCADVGAVHEQYAEHIGMLRRTQTSIAGPRTFDLISARVGNLTINAAPSTNFAVSVGPVTPGGMVSATFRVAVNSSFPLVLSFPSGQEFDFVLKDSDGNALWKWSPSATFVRGMHQRTVADEWSEAVEIPWPASANVGDFSVQAWITTAGSPAFSGTAPVRILRQ